MSALQEAVVKKNQEELDDKRKLAVRLEEERDTLREQLAHTKLELQRAVDAQTQLESQRKEAGEKAKEKKEAVSHLKEKLQQQQTDLNRVQLENMQLQARLDTLRSDLETKLEKTKKKAKKARVEGSAFEKEALTFKTQNMLLEEQQNGVQVCLLPSIPSLFFSFSSYTC
jgi:chromosome segregation ATPase